MYPIVKKEILADKIFLMEVKAERCAKSCLPGQFVIVKTDEKGERIPLTICDYDREAGTVTIVVQAVGASTERMLKDIDTMEAFQDFVGPLGCPSELCMEENLEETKKKKIVFIAGGLGTAPVYPQVKWLHEHGVEVDVIMGSRTKDLLFYMDEMKAVSKNCYICTDDGSFGFHGVGTAQLQALYDEGVTYDHDEIRMYPDQEVESSHHRFHESDHGRWNRYVWSLPSCCRRSGEIRVRRRTGI